eukprot:269487-Chlamydomonas_euryale.AAC.4
MRLIPAAQGSASFAVQAPTCQARHKPTTRAGHHTGWQSSQKPARTLTGRARKSARSAAYSAHHARARARKRAIASASRACSSLC